MLSELPHLRNDLRYILGGIVRALAYSISRYAAICHITVDNGHNFVRYATKVGISGDSDTAAARIVGGTNVSGPLGYS